MITERTWRNKTVEGYIKWYKEAEYDVVVNLNCKRWVTKEEIIREAKIMWNKIDCKAYGKANVKRRKMRLKRICMLDGGNGDNRHYHCCVRSGGSFETAQSLVDEINLLWGNSKVSGKHNKTEIYDKEKGNGWLWYLAQKVYDGMECQETSVIDEFDILHQRIKEWNEKKQV